MRDKNLKTDIMEFLLWLTPCGQISPGSKRKMLKRIGKDARRLVKRILTEERG